MSYLIVCCYTLDTPYEKEVKRLIETTKKLGIATCIEGVPNLGTWEKNCQYKANYILKMMEQQPANVVWVDADAEFHHIPTLFDQLQCELAYHYLHYRRELLSGTLFLKNTPKVHQLVKDWIALNATNNHWDQKNLQKLVEADPKLKKEILPAEYCYIKNHKHQQVTDPVITHFQASRRFKRKVNMAYQYSQTKRQ